MIKSYINKIKANITIYSTQKTSNILDGTYKSIYKGRSMNFEDLREYVIGDNVKDIDWKASARTNTILIKRFIAEKKHNILFVMDSGRKMLADTPKKESKKEVALITAGTVAYLANKNGDYVGAIYNKNNSIEYFPFKSDLYNIESILSHYDNSVELEDKDEDTINKSLEYACKHIKRRCIIFVITDLDGMDKVKEDTLKKIAMQHDILFVNIKDAYMSEENIYDIENSEYIPKLLLKDPKILELEKQERKKIQTAANKKLKKCRATVETIDQEKEVPQQIIELLERHRNGNNR